VVGGPKKRDVHREDINEVPLQHGSGLEGHASEEKLREGCQKKRLGSRKAPPGEKGSLERGPTEGEESINRPWGKKLKLRGNGTWLGIALVATRTSKNQEVGKGGLGPEPATRVANAPGSGRNSKNRGKVPQKKGCLLRNVNPSAKLWGQRDLRKKRSRLKKNFPKKVIPDLANVGLTFFRRGAKKRQNHQEKG